MATSEKNVRSSSLTGYNRAPQNAHSSHQSSHRLFSHFPPVNSLQTPEEPYLKNLTSPHCYIPDNPDYPPPSLRCEGSLQDPNAYRTSTSIPTYSMEPLPIRPSGYVPRTHPSVHSVVPDPNPMPCFSSYAPPQLPQPSMPSQKPSEWLLRSINYTRSMVESVNSQSTLNHSTYGATPFYNGQPASAAHIAGSSDAQGLQPAVGQAVQEGISIGGNGVAFNRSVQADRYINRAISQEDQFEESSGKEELVLAEMAYDAGAIQQSTGLNCFKPQEHPPSELDLHETHIVDALTAKIMAATTSSAKRVINGSPSGLDRDNESSQQAGVGDGQAISLEEPRASNCGLTLSRTLALHLDRVAAYPSYEGPKEAGLVQTQSEVKGDGYGGEGRRAWNIPSSQFDHEDRGVGLYAGGNKYPSGLQARSLHRGKAVEMRGDISRNFPEPGKEAARTEHASKIMRTALKAGDRNSSEFVEVNAPKAPDRPQLSRRRSPRFRSKPAPLKIDKDEESSRPAYTSFTAPLPLSSELQNPSFTSSEEKIPACDEDEDRDNKFRLPIGSRHQRESRQSKASAGKPSSKKRRSAKQALTSMFSDDDKMPAAAPRQARRKAAKKKDEIQPVKSSPKKKGRRKSVFNDEGVENLRASLSDVDPDEEDFEEITPGKSARTRKRKTKVQHENAMAEEPDVKLSPALKKGNRKGKRSRQSKSIDVCESPAKRRAVTNKKFESGGISPSSSQGRSSRPIDLANFVEALPRRKSNSKKYASYLYKRLTEEDAALIRIAFTSRYRPPPSNHKVQGFYEAEKGHVMTEEMKKEMWETKLKPWSDRWWKLYQEFGIVGREIKLAKEERNKKPDLTERELRVAVEKFYATNGPAKR